VLWGAIVVHAYYRDWRTVRDVAAELSVLGSTYGFFLCHALGTFGQGWALAGDEHFADGIEQMRQGVLAYMDSKIRTGRVPLQFWLAEMCGKAGRTEEARTLLSVAFELARETQDLAWNAKLYRLKGMLTLQKQSEVRSPKSKVKIPQSAIRNPKLEEAEADFHKAIECARRQQAKLLELQATVSLCRLWQRQGKTADAQRTLAEVYGWFTEGFDLPDLQDAKGLLQELACST
jgi:predicted ATPase